MHDWCCPILSHIVQRDLSALTTDVSVVDSSIDPEKTHNTELTGLDHMNDSQREGYSEITQVSMSMSGEVEVFTFQKILISFIHDAWFTFLSFSV